MKTPRLILSLALFAVCAFLGVMHGIVPALTLLTIGSTALLTSADMLLVNAGGGSLHTVTLTPVLLLQRTMRALFLRVPALGFFASEFTTERLKLNQSVIGKIRLRPTASIYSEVTGYKNGSQKARDLLLDVPFTMDQHIHVTVSLNHLNSLADSNCQRGFFVDGPAELQAAGVVPEVTLPKGSSGVSGRSQLASVF